MSDRKRLPAPGLQGDYSGTCIKCLRPTDSALGFKGEAAWIAAGLVALGIPCDKVLPVLATSDERWRPVGAGPTGVVEQPVRVCVACAASAKMQVRVFCEGSTLVWYTQPGLVS